MAKRRPKVLDARQLALVGVICDLIIPETATPGALSVGAPEYIDFTLTRASIHARQRFLEGLKWIDRESKRCFGRAFVCLSMDQQIALLRRLDVVSSNGDQDFDRHCFLQGHQELCDLRVLHLESWNFSGAGIQGQYPAH